MTTDAELAKMCEQVINEPKLYGIGVIIARALKERLGRESVTLTEDEKEIIASCRVGYRSTREDLLISIIDRLLGRRG